MPSYGSLCLSVSLCESVCVSPWVWVSVRVCVTCENVSPYEVFLYICVSLVTCWVCLCASVLYVCVSLNVIPPSLLKAEDLNIPLWRFNFSSVKWGHRMPCKVGGGMVLPPWLELSLLRMAAGGFPGGSSSYLSSLSCSCFLKFCCGFYSHFKSLPFNNTSPS